MTYLSDRAKKRKTFIRRGSIIGIILLCVLFWVPLRNTIRPFFEPVTLGYAHSKAALFLFPQSLRDYFRLQKELLGKVQSLEMNIERLENELALKEQQLNETKFKEEESLLLGQETKVLTLYPLMEDVTNLYSTILLSKGYQEGVEVGDYVFVRGLQPVCIIKEVYTKTSLCELLTSPRMEVEGVVVNASSSIAIRLQGRGGGTFLGDVMRDSLVKQGDLVYLKSDPSMVLGTITATIHNDQDTSWRVFVVGNYNPLTSNLFYIRK